MSTKSRFSVATQHFRNEDKSFHLIDFNLQGGKEKSLGSGEQIERDWLQMLSYVHSIPLYVCMYIAKHWDHPVWCCMSCRHAEGGNWGHLEITCLDILSALLTHEYGWLFLFSRSVQSWTIHWTVFIILGWSAKDKTIDTASWFECNL